LSFGGVNIIFFESGRRTFFGAPLLVVVYRGKLSMIGTFGVVGTGSGSDFISDVVSGPSSRA